MVDYRALTILIVEDDDGHADLIQEGLCSAGVCNPFRRFCDGEAVWEFLLQSGGLVAAREGTCYLLLLDINMPKMDGIEVLRRIKTHPELKDTPVMMLTTTDDPREVDECYKLGCNMYITKPVDFLKFAETLKRLGLFIQVVKV